MNEILKTIKNMNVLNHDDVYYEAAYTGSQVLNALEDVFNLGLNKKYYRISELNKKSKKISKENIEHFLKKENPKNGVVTMFLGFLYIFYAEVGAIIIFLIKDKRC